MRIKKRSLVLSVTAVAALALSVVATVGTPFANSEGPGGTLDDGAELLPLATISLEQAIAAAQAAASGHVGEVDLEYHDGVLVYNVDVGDKDVRIDAATAAVLAVDSDD